jgi:photosystem II stability/assembly factor-like uncharacterized protein
MKKIATALILICNCFLLNAQNHWQVPPNTGLFSAINARFEDVYFTDSVTGFAVSLNDTGIYKTKDAGRNWTVQRFNDAHFGSIEFLDDKLTGIVGSADDSDKIYRTTDGGNTWTNIAAALIDTVSDNRHKISGMAHWNSTFYAVGSWNSSIPKMYKSTDKGLTWTCLYPDTSLISEAVDVCFSSQDTGFITGTYDDPLWFRPAAVLIATTDGGKTWKRKIKDLYDGGAIWKIQAVSPQVLVASLDPFYTDTVAMFKSVNGGNTWKFVGTGFNSSDSNMWAPKSTQGVGFVTELHGWLGGYYDGLFETWDGGKTWDTISFGGNFNRFFVLDSNHVFAAGKQVYFYGRRLPKPGATAVNELNSAQHKLFPVTPNPANEEVKIEFDLFKTTNVLLQVVSIDSKRSWKLESRSLPAGHFTYYWNGSEAPAGNYIIWLGTDEKPVVQKFTLRH